LFLRVPVLVSQSRQRVGEVERVHVGSLPVLDDLVKQHVVVRGRLHPAGDFLHLGLRRGFESPLARDDAVDVSLLDEPDGDRLQNAEAGNGGIQFALGGRVEPLPRLIGVRFDAINVD
jgi:hypothetical protein